MESGKTSFEVEIPSKKELIKSSMIGILPVTKDWIVQMECGACKVKDIQYSSATNTLYVYLIPTDEDSVDSPYKIDTSDFMIDAAGNVHIISATIHSPGDMTVGIYPAHFSFGEDIFMDPDDVTDFVNELMVLSEFVCEDGIISLEYTNTDGEVVKTVFRHKTISCNG